MTFCFYIKDQRDFDSFLRRWKHFVKENPNWVFSVIREQPNFESIGMQSNEEEDDDIGYTNTSCSTLA